MKQTLPHHSSTARAGSAVALAFLASLAINPLTFAKGKPGGGGGEDPPDPGITINPVPTLVAAPISYTRTEIIWPHDIDPNTGEYVDGFEGTRVKDVNNSGIACGDLLRPAPAEAPAESFAFRYGAVNVVVDADGNVPRDASGNALLSASNQWVDVNALFDVALAQLNADRAANYGDGPWRIVYARRITDAGLVGCEMIQDSPDADAPFNRYWANYYGREATPTLLVVADLTRQNQGGALSIVDSAWTDPDQSFLEIAESGHLHVSNALLDGDGKKVGTVNDVYVWDDATAAYNRITPGPLVYPYAHGSLLGEVNLAVNSSLQMAFADSDSTGSLIYADTFGGSTPNLLWGSDASSLSLWEIAEDNTVYVLEETVTTTGKGRNKTTVTINQPYHILSATERTPLIDLVNDGSASLVVSPWRSVSSGPAGEEEVVFQIEATGEIQLYKPHFAQRFVLDLQMPSGHSLANPWFGPFVSSPFNQGEAIQSSPTNYYGGYIAYTAQNNDPVNGSRSFILTPSQ